MSSEHEEQILKSVEETIGLYQDFPKKGILFRWVDKFIACSWLPHEYSVNWFTKSGS